MPARHPQEIGYGHVVESYVQRSYAGIPRYLVLGSARFPRWTDLQCDFRPGLVARIGTAPAFARSGHGAGVRAVAASERPPGPSASLSP
ncbi:hypothetical protein [Streptomyces sp. NPDC093225]|uniref:hypothetical protein n=1 Tax=Streptomyces sp. NPDC093225 TaxID=3366034 RepID=UPI00380B7DD4